MPDSGFIDESKIDILNRLPAAWIVPSAAVMSGDEVRIAMAQHGWPYPLILKPNRGQRGYGVRRISTDEQVDRYFDNGPQQVLVQTFHPGPFEAGVLYYRLPGETRGRIFSITDKFFPLLEGDGRHTVEQLIYRHPRFRMQADAFLNRHRDRRDHVLGPGKTLRLVVAGNHCQGTEFRDGSHLITEELTRTFDRIANHYDGFHFGRFDVRYSDVEAFMNGHGFEIVELNGVTSEATDIYDPNRSLLNAYHTLFRQWSTAYRIGAMNRERGAGVTPIRSMLRTLWLHYRAQNKDLARAD